MGRTVLQAYGTPTVLTRHGEPVAVLCSFDTWMDMLRGTWLKHPPLSWIPTRDQMQTARVADIERHRQRQKK